MATTIQDQIYETFAAIERVQKTIPEQMSGATEELARSVSDAAKTMESIGTTWSTINFASGGGTIDTSASLRLLPDANRISTTATTGSEGSKAAAEIGSTVLQTFLNLSPAGSAISDAAQGSSAGSGSGTMASIGSAFLRYGSGVIGLIGSLFGLFGGGDSEAPPPLVKYAAPPSIAFEGLDTAWGVSLGDYDASGMARTYGGADFVTVSPESANGGSELKAPAVSSGVENSSAPQITVNIQAMDARSFLDRSGDIAAAVRDAMLNLNSINDVVNDL